MRQAMARQRGRDGSRGAKWLVVGVIAVALLSTAFGFGVLVGRHHPHQAEVAHATGDGAKRGAPPARRSGLAEPTLDPPAVQEKLTFYQTLTAPLQPAQTPTKVDAAAKPDAAKRPGPDRVAGTPAVERTASPTAASPTAEKPVSPQATRPASLTSTSATAPPEKPVPAQAPRPAAVAAAPASDWTVQVGAFKERDQAESVRKPLAAAGLAAYLATVPADDGQVRYKVRVGTFKTREEAMRMAERMRQERSLATFVTLR